MYNNTSIHVLRLPCPSQTTSYIVRSTERFCRGHENKQLVIVVDASSLYLWRCDLPDIRPITYPELVQHITIAR